MLNCKKEEFSLPEDITYLNCAYMSPLLKSVQQAGINGIFSKSDPSGLEASDFFDPVDDVRNAFSKLIECPDPRRIAIIPSASYGLANIANNIHFKKGEEILLVEDQFPSNYYIWKLKADQYGAIIKVVTRGKDIQSGAEHWNERLLESIGSTTKLVSIPIHHWADGSKFLIREIREKTAKFGAYFVLDGTQTIGAFPFSIPHIEPDALICAGYKFLLGPYSIGLAYYGKRFDNGTPIEESWMNRQHSHIFSKLVNYQDDHRPFARRYDVGESSNFILIPMMLTALNQLNQWGPRGIQDYCDRITRTSIDRLTAAGFKIGQRNWRGAHLFGIGLPGNIEPEEIRIKLKEHKIFVSIRGDSVRVSPHLYNTENDLSYLANELKKLTN